jgi:hypothetical protein
MRIAWNICDSQNTIKTCVKSMKTSPSSQNRSMEKPQSVVASGPMVWSELSKETHAIELVRLTTNY